MPLDEDLQERLFNLLRPSHAGPETTVDTGTGMRTEPPQTPEEAQQRKQGFRAMLDALVNDPNGRQAMLTAAAQIMQPIQAGSGETVLNRLIQGAAVGTTQFNELTQQQEEDDLRRELLEMRKAESEMSLMESAQKFGASEQLIQSIIDDPTIDSQTKTRTAALIRAGETKAGLELAFEKSGSGEILSPREIRELNPNIDPSTMIVARKKNGDYQFTEIPGAAGSADNTLTERKAQVYEQILIENGMEPQQAKTESYRVATGETSILVSDDGTRATFVRTLDAVSGKGTGAQVVVAEPPVTRGVTDDPQIPPEELLFGETAERAPGLTGFYHNVLANIPSPIKGDMSERQTETVEARKRLNLAVRNIIKARALNPRFIGAEQEQIRKDVDIDPALLTNPDALRSRMRAVDEAMKNDIELGERDLRENTFVDAEKVQNLRASIRDMKNFRRQLGVERAKEMRENLTVEKAKRLSEDEMNFLVLSSEPEELAQLPDDVFDALEARRNKLIRGF